MSINKRCQINVLDELESLKLALEIAKENKHQIGIGVRAAIFRAGFEMALAAIDVDPARYYKFDFFFDEYSKLYEECRSLSQYAFKINSLSDYSDRDVSV